MKQTAVLAILAASALAMNAGGGEQGAPNRAAIEKTIVANERAVITAIMNNDPKTFHSHVVPESYLLGDDGPTKVTALDQQMVQMKTDCKIAKWDISDSAFYWVNESTVIHMFKTVLDGTCKGQSIPTVWASTVWSKSGGNWLGAFHQETPVATPAAAPKK
jgi:hypothetical protein